MSKYAIVQLLGKQLRVSEGEEVIVDRVTSTEEGKTFDVSDVLLVADDKDVKVGQPTVAKAKVTFEVKEHGRAKKIRVAKFKAKSKYRRVKGHKQHQSTLVVKKITA